MKKTLFWAALSYGIVAVACFYMSCQTDIAMLYGMMADGFRRAYFLFAD